MEDMNLTLTNAVRVQSDIDRAVTNYKKDGPARKTHKYLNEKLQYSLTLDKELKTTHDAFMEQFPEPSEIYLQDKEEATKLVNWLKQELSYQIQKLEEFARSNTHLDLTKISLADLRKTSNQPDPKKDEHQGELEEEISFFKNDESDDQLLKKLVKAQDGLFQNIKYQLKTMENIEEMTTEQLEYRMSRLSRSFKKAEDTDFDIWSLATEAEVLGYRHELFFQLSSEVEAAITKLRVAANEYTRKNASSISKTLPKLPEISCPAFEGDYRLWNGFLELFCELIDNRKDIGNVQKLMYLRDNLDGPPKKLIENMALVEKNYQIALKTLKERYDNDRLIVNAHLSQMLDRQIMTQQNATSLRTLHDDIKESLHALNRMGIDTKDWDPILQFLLTRFLDNKTKMLFEIHLKDAKAVPKVDTILNFLQIQFTALEAYGRQHSSTKQDSKKNALVSTVKACILNCNEEHYLYLCPVFKKLTTTERYNLIREQNLCLNCLTFGHKVVNCRSRSCTKCNKKHHTLIHMEQSSHPEDNLKKLSEVRIEENSTSSLAASNVSDRRTVLLATAMVTIKHKDSNRTLTCRAVLDSGSQLNFVSSSIFKKLGVAGSSTNVDIEGIGLARRRCRQKVDLVISSDVTKHALSLPDVIVMENITSSHPSLPINVNSLGVPNNIMLADKDFGNPKEIGILLGAGIVGPLLLPGNITLGEGKPSLQNTKFGWVVIGSVYNLEHANFFCGIASFKGDKIEMRNRNEFWQIDDSLNSRTHNDVICEKLFEKTTTLNEDGRFIVRLPFAQSPNLLGNSENIALSRFFSMERKLETNKELKIQYHDFMQTYLSLGHMEEVKQLQDIGNRKCYLPHHFVLKPGSSTTKLRVVFDAAAATSTNISLNDVLATGPKLQNDLFDIILRFRTHRYVLTGDIQMMYRQILVHSDDSWFSLIFWRFAKSEPVKVFRLKTVTYGTSCAPFLAVKCLQTLAHINAQRYPSASQKILNDFYMDDFITGNDNIEELIRTKTQVVHILEGGKFHLRKWCSNSEQVLNSLPREDCENKWSANTNEAVIKVLGISWKPSSDIFHINLNRNEGYDLKTLTKRQILSEASGIFDPLGLVNPVIIVARILLQELWQTKIDWDTIVGEEFRIKWHNFRSKLFLLKDFQVPRWVFSDGCVNFQIHGFSDASWSAYGAVLYVRTSINSNISVHLLCSKSRVVSNKKKSQMHKDYENKISIPRLELCAAKLLVELVDKVLNSIQKSPSEICLYSDSTTVLQWIRKPVTSLKPYISRRVKFIQEKSLITSWGYVASKDNPADILSRGIDCEKFMNCYNWIEGPLFLRDGSNIPPKFTQVIDSDEVLEEVEFKTLVAKEEDHFFARLNHKNNFGFLVGVVSSILAFANKIGTLEGNNRTMRDVALIKILLYMQKEFQEEIDDLTKSDRVKPSSRLKSLTPFLDKDGLIRVGGRIKNANYLDFDSKHQILLPYGHEFTFLLANEIHKKHFHVSSQALLYLIRQKYWPLRGRLLTKGIVNRCFKCWMTNPRSLDQIMGNLPADRLRPNRPFLTIGVDYIGPMKIHYKIRGKRPSKAYVSVFICFVTKAIHIEVVSDLTTEAFLAAFKRFCARRGSPCKVYSDNATNFQGAQNELKSIITSREFMKEIEQRKIDWENLDTSNNLEMVWKNIPARSPHMGGLWEAAVKSLKTHYERVLLNQSLTFEQLQTTMIEIEAMLNSRPLTPLSEDPNDLQVLSPAHFLIGEPMIMLPDKSIGKPSSIRSAWDVIRLSRIEFWKRWVHEHINELQKRVKWDTAFENVKPGTLVLLKDSNTNPLNWKRARVISSVVGDDGRVRVVEVQTNTGTTRRAVQMICPLPVCEDEQEKVTEIDLSSTETNKKANFQPPMLEQENEIALKSSSLPSKSDTHAPNENESKVHMQFSELTAPNPVAPRVTKSKKPSHWNYISLNLILAMFVFLPLVLCKTNVKYINNNNSLIFFENRGQASAIVSYYNVIAYFNLKGYWELHQNLHDAIGTLRSVCDEADQEFRKSTNCKQVVLGITKQMEQKDSLHAFLFHSRQKRSLLGVVGALAHDLFGVVDENTALKYEEQIQRNYKVDKFLIGRLNEFAALHNSTVNIINSNHEKMLEELKVLRKSLHTRSEKSIFNDLVARMVSTINHFEQLQSTIWDAISHARRGIFNPVIIDPVQLSEALVEIRSQLPTSLTLADNDIFEILKLLQIRARATKEFIIFEIAVPLASSETFSMYESHSFPALHGQVLIEIRSQYRYILINNVKDRYITIPERVASNCIKSKSKWLCFSVNIISLTSQYNECEVRQLFGEPLGSLDDCTIRVLKPEPRFLRLSTNEHWIFVAPFDIYIETSCENKPIVKQMLRGRGVLSTDIGCIIRTPTSTLITYESKNKSLIFATPESNASYISQIQNLTSEIMANNLSSVEFKWRALPFAPSKANIPEATIENHHVAIVYSSLFMSVIVLLTLVAKCIYKKRRTCCSSIEKEEEKHTTRQTEQPPSAQHQQQPYFLSSQLQDQDHAQTLFQTQQGNQPEALQLKFLPHSTLNVNRPLSQNQLNSGQPKQDLKSTSKSLTSLPFPAHRHSFVNSIDVEDEVAGNP